MTSGLLRVYGTTYTNETRTSPINSDPQEGGDAGAQLMRVADAQAISKLLEVRMNCSLRCFCACLSATVLAAKLDASETFWTFNGKQHKRFFHHPSGGGSCGNYLCGDGRYRKLYSGPSGWGSSNGIKGY